jgi:serine protease Do
MSSFDETTPDPRRTDREPTSWTAAAVPVAPAATEPKPRRSGRGIRTVIAACVLSATLASASTTALVSLTLGGSQPAAGTTPNAVVTNTRSDPADLADVVAVARQSVVTITANGLSVRGRSQSSVPSTGVGSGVILTTDGYILTNKHVVEGSTSLTVALPDGTEYPATIVRQLDDNDLALIKIDATGLAAATIGDSTTIEVGQTAIAIGSPLGTYTETVTKGIISALGREITVADEETGRPTYLHDLIQTDAAINPGNSGGPVLDATGAVVGISTATADSAEGLGFAIPISAAAELIALARGTAS